MPDFAAMPFWTDAYMADCGHLTRQEHGTYLLLLMTMWRAPGCRVPNDDAWLGRHLRMSPDEVTAELRPLIEEFCQTDGNWITQKRLSHEHAFVTNQRQRQSDSAKSRWRKETRGQSGNAPTPTPTPTPLEEKKESQSAPKNGATTDGGDLDYRTHERRSGTRLAPTWRPSEEALRFAHLEGYDDDGATRLADGFRDYWIAKPGAAGKKLDWAATWRNWVRTEKDRRPRNGHRPQPVGIVAAINSMLAEDDDKGSLH